MLVLGASRVPLLAEGKGALESADAPSLLLASRVPLLAEGTAALLCGVADAVRAEGKWPLPSGPAAA